jgi:hypothetical protein
MYWLFSVMASLILLFFVLIVLGVLKDNKRVADIVLYALAIYLLVYKVTEYIYWQAVGLHYKIPIEFSALSYFLFAFAVFFKKKPLTQIATFYAPVAGFFFYISFIISPTTFANSDDTVFLFIMSIVNHGLVFLGGFLLLNTQKLTKNFFWEIPLATGAMLGYSYLMVFLTNTPESVVIIDLVEGNLLDGMVAPFAGFTALYFIVLFGLYFSVMAGFYFYNKKVVKEDRRILPLREVVKN